MTGYILSCCSAADLTQEHFENREIHYASYHYYLDGREYCDDLGQSLPLDEFYQAMASGAETKTTQISVGAFCAYFEPFLKQERDIIHVCLSSGITGVMNAANIARSDLLEIYPDRKIYLVDSLCASSGYGLFMDKLADLRDSGWESTSYMIGQIITSLNCSIGFSPQTFLSLSRAVVFPRHPAGRAMC